MCNIWRKILLFVVAGIFLSCNIAAPRLHSTLPLVRHVFNPNMQTYYDELSIFLMVTDKDGKLDISDIFVINKDAQLSWHFDKGNWILPEKEYGGDSILLARVIMPVDTEIPTGTYQIVVYDKAGKQDKGRFYLFPPEKGYRDLIPSLTQNVAGKLTVNSKFRLNYLFILEEHIPILQASVTPGQIISKTQQPLYLGTRYKNRFYFSGPYYP